ncbi:MAG: hypothetical protein AAFN70_18075 [Planctomycetota bacterium]
MDQSDTDTLIAHLRSLNCNDREIEQIVTRVRQYDRETIHQSVFESIESGSFNIQAIVAEIRADQQEDG